MAAGISNDINQQFFFMAACHPVIYPKNLNQQDVPLTFFNKEHKIFSQVLNHPDKLL